MPKIEITEIDNTSPGVLSEDLDVVYIPGFVDTTQSCLQDKSGEYIGIKSRVPTLFTSVSSFTTLCGTKPLQFSEKQSYPAFSTNAVPPEGCMFNEGDYDPSYIMAKELLSAGLNVLYERINPDFWKLIGTTRENFANIDDGYYKVVISGYESIIADSAPVFVPNIFYKQLPKDQGYAVLETKPDDWESEFSNYYRAYYVEREFSKLNGTVEGDPLETPNNVSVVEKLIYMRGDAGSVELMYQTLEDVFDTSARDGLGDKGNYGIKYLTSGGYPVYEYNNGSLVTKMLNLAKTRGDCVAIIDHTDNPDRESNIDRPGSIYSVVRTDVTFDGGEDSLGAYGAMFTPWAWYNRTTSDKDGDKLITTHTSVKMSGGYAYLAALADSIKTNAPWLAVAGSVRGVVRNLAQNGMTTYISNGAADAMQPRNDGVSVNAITNIRPYGYTIWGNRTLRRNGENLVATSFLNIRNLVSDVKKVCYRAARKLTFEQNNDVLWVNFKAEIAPTLDRMVSGYGLSGYKLIRDTAHEKAAEKATLCAKIFLYPVYPVEDFYVTILLQDDEVSVE